MICWQFACEPMRTGPFLMNRVIFSTFAVILQIDPNDRVKNNVLKPQGKKPFIKTLIVGSAGFELVGSILGLLCCWDPAAWGKSSGIG